MSAGASEVRSCFCLQARRTARQLTQVYDRALRPSGLRVTQFQLLAALEEAQPITVQPLAEQLGMDRTTLTRNLSLLERDGFVSVEPGATDRRERRLSLTPAGREAFSRALPLWRVAQGQVAADLRSGKETGLSAAP